MTHLSVIGGETKTSVPPFRNGGGLRRMTPGTINDSSPTANFAGVNIKGKWIISHFPRGL
jgi:hypothetical protein